MNKEGEPILFQSYGVFEGCLWLTAKSFNGLFKYNFLTKKLEFVSIFADEGLDIQNSKMGKIMQYEDNLIFIPNKSNYIHMYNFHNNKMTKVLLEQKITGNYASCVKYGDEVIFVPYRGKSLFKYNLLNHQIDNIDICNGVEWYHRNTIILNDKLYFTAKNTAQLFIYDLQRGSFESVILDFPGNIIIKSIKNTIEFFNPQSQELIFWDTKGARIREKKHISAEGDLMLYVCNVLLLLDDDRGIGFDIINNETYEQKRIRLQDDQVCDFSELEFAVAYNERIYFQWGRNGKLYSMNQMGEDIQEEADFIMTKELKSNYLKYMNDNRYNGIIFQENSDCCLNDYLHIIVGKNI